MAKICKCIPFPFKEKKFEELKDSLENTEELEGIVVDEAEAYLSPCEHIKGTNLYYSKGIIGALSQEQVDKYCKMGIIEVERPEIVERHKKWKEAVKVCKMRTAHLKGGERVKKFIECMEEEAKD